MLTNRQLFLRYLGQTSFNPMMLEIVKAEGIYMYGPGDERYIDLISGVSVSNTGHNHPKVIAAIKDQADSYLHLMVYGEIIQSPQVKYAGRLIELLPEQLNSCYFVNSGSEAVEGALKLAKRYTGRGNILSFKKAYHGSTHGALSIQGDELHKRAYRPLLPGIVQVGFNDWKALGSIGHHTACVIVEPIQGEAGIILPENDFLKEIRKRCDETGTLLVFDEIQTGFGRTGTLFALDRYGVTPDILLLAKALGGGMPLGAFISSNEIMSVLASDPPLGHITTFGGHPLCCTAGLAALEVVIDEDLAEASNTRSALFKRELVHPLIVEVRGEGLLLAVQVVDKKYVGYIVSHAPDHGLILDYFLFCNNAFRIAPPLIITEEEILFACRQIKDLLDDAMVKADS